MKREIKVEKLPSKYRTRLTPDEIRWLSGDRRVFDDERDTTRDIRHSSDKKA